MDSFTLLQKRLDEIRSECSELEGRLRVYQSEKEEIETALRVISKYSDNIHHFDGVSEGKPESGINQADAIIEAISLSGDKGILSGDIKQYLKENLGIDIKPTTLSVTLQRHKSKNKIFKSGDNKWFLMSYAPSEGKLSEPKTEGNSGAATPESHQSLFA